MDKNLILKKYKYPGQYLLDEITKIGMSQSELAVRTGVTAKHISTIINGNKPISVSFSKKLSYVLDCEPEYWIHIQTEYDTKMLELEEENGITQKEFDILKQLKNIEEYFLKRSFIHNDCNKPQKIIQFRKCLGVSNLEAIPMVSYNAAYRAQLQKNSKVNPYVLFAWQRMCELETAEKINCIDAVFNEKELRKNVPKIKHIISVESDINIILKRLSDIFAECGIAFKVVKHFKGAPVQGFIKKADNKVILCLTIRGSYADRFWFTLFHEIGHLLNGDINVRFVDFDSVSNEIENKADEFARNALINPELFDEFVRSGYYDCWQCIEIFAKKNDVPPIIILGRLRKEQLLDWTSFSQYNVLYKWSE